MYGEAMMNEMSMMHNFSWIFMLLFWVLLFIGVIVLVRIFSSKNDGSNSAKGELPGKTV